MVGPSQGLTNTIFSSSIVGYSLQDLTSCTKDLVEQCIVPFHFSTENGQGHFIVVFPLTENHLFASARCPCPGGYKKNPTPPKSQPYRKPSCNMHRTVVPPPPLLIQYKKGPHASQHILRLSRNPQSLQSREHAHIYAMGPSLHLQLYRVKCL